MIKRMEMEKNLGIVRLPNEAETLDADNIART